MECSGSIDDVFSSGVSAGKLDYRFDTFTAGTAEECFRHFPAGVRAQGLSQYAGAFHDVALKHRWRLPLQLRDQLSDDVGVIMAWYCGHSIPTGSPEWCVHHS